MSWILVPVTSYHIASTLPVLHCAEKQFSEVLDGPFSYLSHPLIFWQVLETGDTLGEVTESVEYYTEGGTIIAGNLFGR
jgi:hypothetical protein